MTLSKTTSILSADSEIFIKIIQTRFRACETVPFLSRNCRYCADRDKICQGQPHIWLTLFQISTKSAHIRRSHCRTHEYRICPV